MLDTLPIEIIQRIAAYGPCESNLSLLKVNRTLNRACNVRIVFKDIIKNGNSSSTDLPIWRSVPLSTQSPGTSWAKHALADSKAAQLSCRYTITDEAAIDSDIHDIVGWLPQLVASHRKLYRYNPILIPRDINLHMLDPITDCVSVEYLYDRYNSLLDLTSKTLQAGEETLTTDRNAKLIELFRTEPYPPEDSYYDPKIRAYALSLCLAARLMSTSFLGGSGSLVPMSGSDEPTIDGTAWTTIRDKLLYELNTIFFRHVTVSAENLWGKVNTTRSLAAFAFELRSAIASGRICTSPGNWTNASTTANIALSSIPTARSIPFLSFMQPLAIPFTANSAAKLLTSHLETMTSPDFLCSGTWTGYYSYPARHEDYLRFDPPMQGITFTVENAPLDENPSAGPPVRSQAKLKLLGSGTDAVGKFMLRGTMKKATGSFHLVKQYTAGMGHSWEWSAIMTPFGIYGEWHRNGFFWLWKTEWAEAGEPDGISQSPP